MRGSQGAVVSHVRFDRKSDIVASAKRFGFTRTGDGQMTGAYDLFLPRRQRTHLIHCILPSCPSQGPGNKTLLSPRGTPSSSACHTRNLATELPGHYLVKNKLALLICFRLAQ